MKICAIINYARMLKPWHAASKKWPLFNNIEVRLYSSIFPIRKRLNVSIFYNECFSILRNASILTILIILVYKDAYVWLYMITSITEICILWGNWKDTHVSQYISLSQWMFALKIGFHVSGLPIISHKLWRLSIFNHISLKYFAYILAWGMFPSRNIHHWHVLSYKDI